MTREDLYYDEYFGCWDFTSEELDEFENTVYNQAIEDIKKELVKIYHKRYMHDIYLDDIDDIVESLKR